MNQTRLSVHVVRIFVLVCLLPLMNAASAAPPSALVIEAEKHLGEEAKSFRDPAASGGAVAVLMLPRGGTVFKSEEPLPPGDYLVVAHLNTTPVSLIHSLAVRVVAGEVTREFGAVQFEDARTYQQFLVRVCHRGGKLRITISATGTSGFDGMRKAESKEEKEATPAAPDKRPPAELGGGDKEPGDLRLEEDAGVATLSPLQHRVMCDKVEIRPIAPADALVTDVRVEKIHYTPTETVNAVAALAAPGAGGEFQLVATLLSEIDAKQEVLRKTVKLTTGTPLEVPIQFKLDDKSEFGRELRCTLLKGNEVVHQASEMFGVSRNVYRIGITGYHLGAHSADVTEKSASDLMRDNKRHYANFFEVFAWAPCDYSNLNPETELFFSGQTQYPGSVTGMKTLIAEAHKVGIKAITYGKACGGGIAGYETLRRHPELFGRSAAYGTASEAINTFYLDLMAQNLYHVPDPSGQARAWQHWASLWTRFDSDATVDYGAQAILDGVKTFGWDGVRWDGHFVGNQVRFLKRFEHDKPDFVHGYNVSFANPADDKFIPPGDEQSRKDFKEIAANHGMIMDESVREWSHTNYSTGVLRPFYDAICREADYEKRIGGLPLYITIDMGTAQDTTWCVLMGLAAGQRYTYITEPRGNFAYGSLPKFLTRYSAFVWDDTARIADAANVVHVTAAAGLKSPKPWYEGSTWLRKVDGGQQLIVNVLNPPNYPAFCNRVQTPPTVLHNVGVSVKTPAGAKLTRVMHLSPDLVDGAELLNPVDAGGAAMATIPRLHHWSILVFDYAPASGKELAYPAFPLTHPVEDADAAIAAAAKAAATQPAPKPADAPKDGHREDFYADFDHVYNVDEGADAKVAKPADMSLRRNGVLDVLHCRGVYSWLNPVHSAVALSGGGRVATSYLSRVGFRLGPEGDMDEFPDDYPSLLAYDVIILDNVHAIDLGARRRAMIAKFVNNGGGLLVMGGIYNLSNGADRNTALADLLPVTITKYADEARDDKGMALAAADPAFFPGADWSKAGAAFCVDLSAPKPDAKVLAKAGTHPAIVSRVAGKGRVIVVLTNVHGDPRPDVTPYWKGTAWPRILAGCLSWLGPDARTTYVAKAEAKRPDPTKPDPATLTLEAVDLSPAELTERLKGAMANVVDADSAKALLHAATANARRVTDTEVLRSVADLAAQFADPSFGPMAEELIESHDPVLRGVGYQVVGLAKDKSRLDILLKALTQEDQPHVVHALLVAMASIQDARAVPAVRAYVPTDKVGQKLTALTVLLRLGGSSHLADALATYANNSVTTLGLTIARSQAVEYLYGGQSFKLTPDMRRRGKNDLTRLTAQLAGAREELEYFRAALLDLDAAGVDAFTAFAAKTDSTAVESLAYEVYGRLPSDAFHRATAPLREAKLETFRLLATQQ